MNSAQQPEVVVISEAAQEASDQPIVKTNLRRYLDILGWGALALLAPITALILLSQNALPGSFFYPVKSGFESAILAAASVNPSTKAAFRTDLADRRLKEAQELLIAKADTSQLTNFVDEVAITQQEISALSDITQKAQLQSNLDKKITQYQDQLRATEQQISAQNPSPNSSAGTTGQVQPNPQNSPIQNQVINQTTIIQYIYVTNPTTGQKEQVAVTPTPTPPTPTTSPKGPANTTITAIDTAITQLNNIQQEAAKPHPVIPTPMPTPTSTPTRRHNAEEGHGNSSIPTPAPTSTRSEHRN